MKNNKLGSNQFLTKYKYPLGLDRKPWYSVVMLLLIVFTLFIVFRTIVVSQKPQKLFSPVVERPEIMIVEVKSEEEGDPVITEINRTFKNENRTTIAKVIHCFMGESGLRTDAVNVNRNGTKDIGIAQINDIHKMSLQDRFDYRKNIKKAYEIFKSRGFSAWYSKNCR